MERCRDLLGEAEELQALFREEPRLLRGRVRVGMSGSMAARLVLPQLGAFLQAHPGLEIELGAGERRVDVVREGYDCVVRTGGVVDDSLVARPLGLAAVANCASPDYLRRHGVPRTPWLTWRRTGWCTTPAASASPPWAGSTRCPTAAMRPGDDRIGHGRWWRCLCWRGAGRPGPDPGAAPWAWVRCWRWDALVEVLTDLPAEPMPVTLLYPRQRHLPRRVREVMDWLARVLSPHLQPLPR